MQLPNAIGTAKPNANACPSALLHFCSLTGSAKIKRECLRFCPPVTMDWSLDTLRIMVGVVMPRLRFSIRMVLIVTVVIAVIVSVFVAPDFAKRRLENQLRRNDFSAVLDAIPPRTDQFQSLSVLNFVNERPSFWDVIKLRRNLKVVVLKDVKTPQGETIPVLRVYQLTIRFCWLEN